METEEPSATKVAPKFDKTSIMTGDKFDDRKLARVKLPTREQRQFYASEKLEDCLSLRVVIGFGGIRPHLEACENSLISDLPGTHFDGRPINRERPFLVGLGRVIRRPTNDFKLDREPNVDPMFCAKPHGPPSFRMFAPRSFGPKE